MAKTQKLLSRLITRTISVEGTLQICRNLPLYVFDLILLLCEIISEKLVILFQRPGRLRDWRSSDWPSQSHWKLAFWKFNRADAVMLKCHPDRFSSFRRLTIGEYETFCSNNNTAMKV